MGLLIELGSLLFVLHEAFDFSQFRLFVIILFSKVSLTTLHKVTLFVLLHMATESQDITRRTRPVHVKREKRGVVAANHASVVVVTGLREKIDQEKATHHSSRLGIELKVGFDSLHRK